MKFQNNKISNLKFVILLVCLSFSAYSQTEISGIVIQKNGTPIPGANVYLEGTYDGTTTDDNGKFLFTTSEINEQVLVASFVSFETFRITKSVSEMQQLTIKLREDVSSLDTVAVSYTHLTLPTKRIV